MKVRIIWLSPEQPPEGCPHPTPEQDDDRRDDIQQKQLSLIRHYRAMLAGKDEEMQTLKAGLDQRHALIDQQRVELDGLRQDNKTLKNMLRAKGDEIADLRRKSTTVELARLNADLKHLRKENAELQAEQERLSRFYKTYCAEQHAALDKVLRDMATQ